LPKVQRHRQVFRDVSKVQRIGPLYRDVQEMRRDGLAQVLNRRSINMDAGTIIVIVVILVIVGWIYNAGHKSGKREGSIKVYGVGFDRGRRSKGQSGCLVVLLVLGLALAASAAALACVK
jgi:hypothetical protein